MERSELNDFRARREAKEKEKQVPQLRSREQLGLRMSQLTAHPDWEIYGRYLEAERAKAEAYCKVVERALLNLANPLLPQDELKAKLNLANHQGVLEAFNYALNIAKVLITDGEEAAKAVAGMKETT